MTLKRATMAFRNKLKSQDIMRDTKDSKLKLALDPLYLKEETDCLAQL